MTAACRSDLSGAHPDGVSGIGRETHKMLLEHYSQVKNLLVSYSSQPLGLF